MPSVGMLYSYLVVLYLPLFSSDRKRLDVCVWCWWWRLVWVRARHTKLPVWSTFNAVTSAPGSTGSVCRGERAPDSTRSARVKLNTHTLTRTKF